MKAKVVALVSILLLGACSNSKVSRRTKEQCSLNQQMAFGFADAQYYSMPKIDFTFSLHDGWEVRTPAFGKQNLSYYEIARYNDDTTGSVLIKIHPFKREGAYTRRDEQIRAQMFWNFHFHERDSWVTQSKDTIDGWWVHYGIYEQEPERPHVIAHTLLQRDTLTNGLLLELIMPCTPGNFALSNEHCLTSVIDGFKIHL